MKTIGLLSDTHGYWDEKYLFYFNKCDEIWHAGDIGTLEVADNLCQFKKFRAVCGNIDDQRIRLEYPELLRFTEEKVDVLMVHIGGYPNKYSPLVKATMETNPPKLLIAGHSHILKVIYDKKYNCLTINPGAAGKSGFHKVRTLVTFCLDAGSIKDLNIIELSD